MFSISVVMLLHILNRVKFEFSTIYKFKKEIEGVTKRSRQTNCRFTTVSSQISAIYINIFHKTELQTVIMRC